MGEFHWKELGLFLIFAFAVFAAYALIMSPPGTLCAAEDLNCVREWISAASGWAATAAAISTILFLHYENKKRDALDWREIASSAQLLRSMIGPQIRLLAAAVRSLDRAETAPWADACLNKMEVAMNDLDNSAYRRASADISVRRWECLNLIRHCRYTTEAALNQKKAVGISHAGLFEGTLSELHAFENELAQIAASANEPKRYRGI